MPLVESQNHVHIIKMDDTTTVGALYVGEADPGSSESSAVWKIKKVTDTSVLFADGDSNFDNIWTNRAILSYS